MRAIMLAAIALLSWAEPAAAEKLAASYHDQAGKTASGSIFDPEALEAGHNSLPFGSIATVTGPKGSVSVKIVDRTRPGLIVLSTAAAKATGIWPAGSGHVSVEPGESDLAPAIKAAPMGSLAPKDAVAKRPQDAEVGIASHYGDGDGFEGRSTANGETYRSSGYTAAHKTLPFGVRAVVTNLSNGKSVIVRINDRGPFIEGRIIDLSPVAFDEIADRSQGVVKVSVVQLMREAALTVGDEMLSGLSPRSDSSDELRSYLCEVYDRAPTKVDSSGDFTWKDPAAAKRMKMDVCDYAIGGMHPDLRESLFAFGRVADEQSVPWTILSAFRDDYRQKIASGYKARDCGSLHGGSCVTKGHGDGRAVDVWVTSGPTAPLFALIDKIGAALGLTRPMKGNDPAHVQLGGNWQLAASKLRQARTGQAAASFASIEVRPLRVTVKPAKKQPRKRRGKDEDDD